MDVSFGTAGGSGSGCGVVCPKQEATLQQSLDNHLVCVANIDSGLSGVAALQSVDSAEVQLSGDAYDYPCARQFLIRRPLQGLGVLQKRLSGAV